MHISDSDSWPKSESDIEFSLVAFRRLLRTCERSHQRKTRLIKSSNSHMITLASPDFLHVPKTVDLHENLQQVQNIKNPPPSVDVELLPLVGAEAFTYWGYLRPRRCWVWGYRWILSERFGEPLATIIWQILEHEKKELVRIDNVRDGRILSNSTKKLIKKNTDKIKPIAFTSFFLLSPRQSFFDGCVDWEALGKFLKIKKISIHDQLSALIFGKN